MKWITSLFLSVLLATAVSAKTKIACVGDSITFGAGVAARERLNYPAQLGYLLGGDYEVKNFGVSGRTMLKKGDHPIWNETAYKQSLAYQPNVVIIKLGTNDSKPHNWKFKAEYVQDTKDLVASYRSLPSNPRVILCQPAPVVKDRWGITEKVTRDEVARLVQQAALESQAELVDLHAPLRDAPNILPDGVHPNAFGAERMARYLRQYLTVQRDPTFVLKDTVKAETASFHGYQQSSFNHNGADCKIVRPKIAAKGAPWIWRARFWGHQPQLDIAMLERGWHVVYCDVADLFGAPAAVARWNAFYQLMQSYRLAKKPVLEGMSRGGLIIHNWAVANPDKVAGIICDNGVLDIRSWPAGFGDGPGAAQPWVLCKQAYGFKNDQQARSYKNSPVHTLQILKAAGIPLLYLVGETDKTVPPAENSLRVEKLLGSYAQIIRKPDQGHHPHSLPNPAALIDFTMRCNGTYQNPAAVPAPSAEYRGKSAGWGGGIWWDQHENICKIAKQNKDLELILFGDSITQSWTGPHHRIANANGQRTIDKYFGSHWKTASFGISGDRTEHLLFRLNNGNFDGLQPKAVVIMIGVNNLITRGDNADQTADGIKAVVKAITQKLPDTKILLLGPLPSGLEKNNPRRVTIRKIHQLIKPLEKAKNVTYKNMSRHFLSSDGMLNQKAYSNDHIHLQKAGYELWAKALFPELEKLLKQ